jgi:hypothetical protein
MNFGNIREQVEGVIGASINAATLAGWINSAQIEIAKRYGKRMRMWYPPVLATLRVDIEADTDNIALLNAMNVPEPPDTLIIGDGGLYEKISYTVADHLSVSGVTRGVDSTDAIAWPLGTEVRGLPVASKEYPLPDDILTLHEVRDINNIVVFKKHISPDNQIAVLMDGLYYISYTRVPEPIDYTNGDTELEVHQVFYNDVVQFCVARYWQSIAEAIPGEENKALALMNEFTQSIERSAKHLNRIPSQQYTIGFELW